jgi:hypothetical protein
MNMMFLMLTVTAGLLLVGAGAAAVTGELVGVLLLLELDPHPLASRTAATSVRAEADLMASASLRLEARGATTQSGPRTLWACLAISSPAPS